MKNKILYTAAAVLLCGIIALAACSVGTNAKEKTSQNESQSSAVSSKKTEKTESSQTQKNSQNTKSAVSVENAMIATISVDASKAKEGFSKPEVKIEIKDGESVYDATKRYCQSQNIKIYAQGSGQSVYVKRIGDVSEFDDGSMSGWIYSVNSKIASVGCASYILKSGDKVRWMYTVDLGKTEASEK